MLTREDFKFYWRGCQCYVEGHTKPVTEWNASYSLICKEEKRRLEQDFIDMLNAILPQDGYREYWMKFKHIMATKNNSSIVGLMNQIESSPEKGEINTKKD